MRSLAAIALTLALTGPLAAETVAPPPPVPPPGNGPLGAGGLAAPDPTPFTDAAWDDGLAEVAHYDLTQFRYGEHHPGQAVLIVVREHLDPARVVKAAGDVDGAVPVLKAHLVKSFATGVYRYEQACTVLARRADGVPLRLLVGSHEWCGTAGKSWVNRGEGSLLRVQSYFDGHGDVEQPLALGARDVLEDALPLWLRGVDGARATALEAIRVVPTQLEARAQSTVPVPARLAARAVEAEVPAGRFPAWELDLVAEGSQPAGDGVAWPSGAARRWVAVVERAAPRRLLRWRDGAGTELVLTRWERTDYWTHHGRADAPRRTPDK